MDEPKKWPELDRTSRRLLGVLVEKAKTTPDAYPLSVNALVVGSNQKSNRDPLLNLTDEDVEEGLAKLQQMGLTTRITGGRVERFRHNLYEKWLVDKIELAVLAELMLRGPQTEGELRSRASRMEPIADLDVQREKLKRLQERGLVKWVGEEGRRGSLVTHGFHAAGEVETHVRHVAEESSEPAAAAERADPAMREELTALKAELASLRQTIDRLVGELAELKKSLGA
jgi:uncharacterized protein YceH (UPF0502 family)